MPHCRTLRGALLAHVLLSVVAMGGCGPPFAPFTKSLRTNHRLTGPEVACLQYFLSEAVVLERDVTEDDRQVQGGRLEMRGNRRIHIVEFPTRVPGLARPPRDIYRESIGVRFGVDQPTPLYFAATRGDLYRLVASPSRTVEFDGAEYRVIEGETAHLLIRTRGDTGREQTRDVYRGYTLEDEDVGRGRMRRTTTRGELLELADGFNQCVEQREGETVNVRSRSGRRELQGGNPSELDDHPSGGPSLPRPRLVGHVAAGAGHYSVRAYNPTLMQHDGQAFALSSGLRAHIPLVEEDELEFVAIAMRGQFRLVAGGAGAPDGEARGNFSLVGGRFDVGIMTSPIVTFSMALAFGEYSSYFYGPAGTQFQATGGDVRVGPSFTIGWLGNAEEAIFQLTGAWLPEIDRDPVANLSFDALLLSPTLARDPDWRLGGAADVVFMERYGSFRESVFGRLRFVVSIGF